SVAPFGPVAPAAGLQRMRDNHNLCVAGPRGCLHVGAVTHAEDLDAASTSPTPPPLSPRWTRRTAVPGLPHRPDLQETDGKHAISYLSPLPPVSSIQTARRRRYCTFAVTDAVAFSVKVQVLALFPPLEQAPDQMASRPFETVSVIEVPVVNGADPVLPTGTLIPTGVEVILSPLRPVAVTVSLAVRPGAGAGR